MNYDTQRQLELQNQEFSAANELCKQVARHAQTPVVDDDYPEVRHAYESALAAFVEAMRRNGRFAPGNRYGVVDTQRPRQQDAMALDSARLDYLERHPRAATIVIDGKSVECCFYGVSSCEHGMKLRDVLDQLRAREQH